MAFQEADPGVEGTETGWKAYLLHAESTGRPDGGAGSLTSKCPQRCGTRGVRAEKARRAESRNSGSERSQPTSRPHSPSAPMDTSLTPLLAMKSRALLTLEILCTLILPLSGLAKRSPEYRPRGRAGRVRCCFPRPGLLLSRPPRLAASEGHAGRKQQREPTLPLFCHFSDLNCLPPPSRSVVSSPPPQSGTWLGARNRGVNETVSCLCALTDQEELQQRNTQVYENEQTPRRINT